MTTQQTNLPEPGELKTYLCQGWGETDYPSVAIVQDLDAVRQFFIDQWLGSADHTHDDGTNSLDFAMQDLADHWELEGERSRWSIEFEIGGVSVERVDDVGSAADRAQRVKAEPVADGRLHSDGYFTWNKGKRPDYIANRGLPCDFYFAAPQAEKAPSVQAVEPSPTSGMNMAQRILHVGGRNPPGSTYVEFGSIQAVEALVRHALRDAVNPRPPAIPEDADGRAFRTAAKLGLTLRFYGGCAQSGMPGSPSAYEVVTNSDRAAAMREAVARVEAVAVPKGQP